MVFLVAASSGLANNLTAFLIFEIFIKGYMLIASTDAFFTPSLFKSNSSGLPFRSNYWMMETSD